MTIFVNIVMYYIYVILLFPMFACAGDIDKCNQIHEANQKHFCVALTTVSVTDCDKITNMELKVSCVLKVRDAQRNINSFHPMKDKIVTP